MLCGIDIVGYGEKSVADLTQSRKFQLTYAPIDVTQRLFDLMSY